MDRSLAERYAREPVWAVVGASNHRRKFGNRIYRALRDAGYTVYAVNDHEREVEGDPAYARLGDLPRAPTVVDFVIPPEKALRVAEDAVAAGARCLWFQPGAESATAADLARHHGLAVVHDCILVRLVQMPDEPSGAQEEALA
jgi:predicted CoA-binding protein